APHTGGGCLFVRCLGGVEGRVGGEDPVVGEPFGAAVGPVVDVDGADRCRIAEVDLPPRRRIWSGVGGVGDGVVPEVAVDVAVDGAGGVGAEVVGGGLGGGPAEREVGRRCPVAVGGERGDRG